MRLKLYYEPGAQFENDPVNEGFGEALKLLKKLKATSAMEIELVDTTGWTDEQRSKVYSEAWMPAVWKKFHIRRVFGSKNYSGKHFGRGVPGLLVYEEGSRITPADVYPHEERGTLVTIEQFVNGLPKSMSTP